MKQYILTLFLVGVLLIGGFNTDSIDIKPTPIVTEDTRPTPQIEYEDLSSGVKPTETATEDTKHPTETAGKAAIEVNDPDLTEYALSTLQYLHNRMIHNEMTAEDEAKLLDLRETYGDKVDKALKEMDKKDRLFEAELLQKEIEQQANSREESIRDLISYSSDESLNNSLIAYISKAPDSILNAVINTGYHIELVPAPGDGYGYRYICGLTITDERKIRIQSRESKFRKAVIHEMSHVFDESLGWVSETEEFKKIFDSEVSSFRVHDYQSNHYKDNIKEYFAEACQEYTYHPTELKENAPKTYKFIKNLV